MASFTRKILEVHLTLAADSFGGRGNRKIIDNAPIEVEIEKPGPPDKHKCKVNIYNMALKDMEQLTTLAFRKMENRKNLITVLAGDEKSQALSVAFSGEIDVSFPDFNQSENVPMYFECSTGGYPALIASKPMSVSGSTDLANVIGKLASDIGYTFKNEGFSGQLRNSVLMGSPLEQIRQAAREANAGLIIDDMQVIILPKGKSRQNQNILLTPATGMIGYPTFTSTGLNAKAYYNPAYRYGCAFRVESMLPKANGNWKVTKLTHSLSANLPEGGPWETAIEAVPYE